MKNKKGILSVMAVFFLISIVYNCFRSFVYDLNSYNSLIIENVEALTFSENNIPQIRWKAMHAPCYRSELIGGVITQVATEQIYGFSVADPSGSDKQHDHGCTFYCPGY